MNPLTAAAYPTASGGSSYSRMMQAAAIIIRKNARMPRRCVYMYDFSIIDLLLFACRFLYYILTVFLLFCQQISHSLACHDKILQTDPIQLPAKPRDIDCQRIFIDKAVRLPEPLHQGIATYDLAHILI